VSWRSIRIRPGAHREAVLDHLFDWGAGGVEEDADALVTYFPDAIDVEALAEFLRAIAPDATIEIGDLPAQDWSQAWKARLYAHRIDGLTVAPPWLIAEDPAKTDGLIVIDPGMAFGTGHHATTRGVLALMQRVIRLGDRVADLGAGSAILSIAAARLGAARVAAIESDPDAIGNAEENVALNGLSERVYIVEGDARLLLPLVKPVRVVLANIVSSVLLELLPAIGDALDGGGEAILSGILASERAMMVEALDPAWRIRHELEDEGWWTVAIAPR